jgi:hypothetical protein
VPERVNGSHKRVWIAAVGTAVAGSFLLLIAAKAAQHEARLVERLRPVCEHSGFTNVELVRLVRSETRPFGNKEEALRNLTAICLARHRSVLRGDPHFSQDGAGKGIGLGVTPI